MRKDKFIREQKLNKIYENSGISLLNNANLISVDIQPEYESGFGNMINESYDILNSLSFLFNGPDLGFPDEYQYKEWLIYECEIDETIIDTSNFYDKGYAFFRYCIDTGIDDEDIVDLLKFMISNDINDSRDIDEEMWNEFMQQYNLDSSEVRDLLEYSDDLIHIPDLMDYLRRFGGNIVLCGGGLNECLKEVEIALMTLNKPYRLYTQYTY